GARQDKPAVGRDVDRPESGWVRDRGPGRDATARVPETQLAAPLFERLADEDGTPVGAEHRDIYIVPGFRRFPHAAARVEVPPERRPAMRDRHGGTPIRPEGGRVSLAASIENPFIEFRRHFPKTAGGVPAGAAGDDGTGVGCEGGLADGTFVREGGNEPA